MDATHDASQRPAAAAAGATATRDRERDRSPPSRERDDGVDWRTARDLQSTGLPMPILQEIETWCYRHALSAHVLRFVKGKLSAIVTMSGTCYHCCREHSNNHWVLIATPGFATIRVLCHSTGKVENVRAPFVSALINLL